jgi:hypothetical protein
VQWGEVEGGQDHGADAEEGGGQGQEDGGGEVFSGGVEAAEGPREGDEGQDVKRHVSHIFDKLEATNRTQAVALARDLGLIHRSVPP